MRPQPRGPCARSFKPRGGGLGGGGPTYLMLAPGSFGGTSVPTRPAPVTLHCQLDGGDEDPFAAAAAAAASAEAGAPDAVGPTMLEARNGERHSDVVCSTAGAVRWTDRCSESRATHIAGTKAFAAVFFENGTVQLYTPAGRRAMPPMVTPGRAAFVSASGGRLVAVGALAVGVAAQSRRVSEIRQLLRQRTVPVHVLVIVHRAALIEEVGDDR